MRWEKNVGFSPPSAIYLALGQGQDSGTSLGSGSKFTFDLGAKDVLTQTQRFQKPHQSPVAMGWSDRALGKASPDLAQVKGCSLVRGWWEGGWQVSGSAVRHLCLPQEAGSQVSVRVCALPAGVWVLRMLLWWLLLCLRASFLLLPTFNLFQFGFPLSLLAC